MGLPIAKALVDALDGEINVESEMGMGSTVTLRFPRYAGALENVDVSF